MKICSFCGAKTKDSMSFCPECGQRISRSVIENLENSEKSPVAEPHHMNRHIKFKPIAIIILICLFAVGGRFYLQHTGLFNFKTDVIERVESAISKKAFADDPKQISSASNSVVLLECYDKQGNLYCTGSGFSLFENGVIVTNYHVIENDVYSITCKTEQGQSFEADYFLATDERNDIAILRTKGTTDITVLQAGSSDNLTKGEKVVAIGCPLGLINSVSTGVFSGYTDDVLQFTASISSGSSGGALFNNAGEVIGITFASYGDGQNLNLAVPVEKVVNLWAKKTEKDKITLAQFYDTQIPSYPISYVATNCDEIKIEGRPFYIEGYVSCFGWYPQLGTAWVFCVQSKEDVYNPILDSDNGYEYEYSRLPEEKSLLFNVSDTTLLFEVTLGLTVYPGIPARILCNNIDDTLEIENGLTLHSQKGEEIEYTYCCKKCGNFFTTNKKVYCPKCGASITHEYVKCR